MNGAFIHLPYPLVLASQSPRRKELLAALVPNFEILAANVDEEAITCADPTATAERLAAAKADAVFAVRPDSIVIGADTVVALKLESEWKQLAKPVDPSDARRMLKLLSARSHVVITGVAVRAPGGSLTFSDQTWVTFRKLGNEEIRSYVAGGEPMDKAGAYAIQGGAAKFVESTKGSISNVIGLPMERLEEVLRSFSKLG